MVIRRLNLRFFRYEISIVLKAFDSNNKLYITWHISLYRRTLVSWKFLSSYFTDCLIRHFFRTINFRQFRKKYALPNDRVFSFANLNKMYFRQYFQPFFTTRVNARLYWYDHKFKSMWSWSVMLLQFGMYWIEIFLKKNNYPRNRAARYCAVLQFILLIKQSLTGVVKTKPLMKRKFMLANYYNLISTIYLLLF